MIGSKDDELVVSLTGAEFTVARVAVGPDGTEMAVPKADEKVLVLRFSVQNPRKIDTDFYAGSLTITAVDAKDVNHVTSFIGRQGTSTPVQVALKPAQKLDVFTAVTVPADGTIPKLIFQRGGEGNPVVRYDLRGKIKPLAAPFADPADSSGLTARREVPAAPAVFYPLMNFDARVDSFAFLEGTLDNQEPEEGKHFLTATMTIKNMLTNPLEYSGGIFRPVLVLASGEKIESNGTLLRPNRDATAQGTLKPGETATLRIYFAVPKSEKPKTLLLQETDDSRTYAFDASSAK
jgi:hypothetical protein